MNQVDRQTHLEFYREHKIAPVRYDLSNIDVHLERRFSLYTKLGVLPLSFANATLLEVAAGTGHNSLYLAQLLPSKLVLLEPNAVAIEHIRQVYREFKKPHTSPELVCTTLEEFFPQTSFDIVICENWLGTSTHELFLLNKLAAMVAKQGVLVLTTVSPIGFVPNLLRRFLSIYLAPVIKTFQERTEILIAAFSSQLKTLTDMTRNHTDWVQDNMLNPAYFGLCLSIPNLVDQLGEQFSVIGSVPTFSEDWRWFKELHGKQSRFNEHFLSEYWQKAHHFLDYRETARTSVMVNNKTLEKKATALLDAIAKHEDSVIAQGDTIVAVQQVIAALDEFIVAVPMSFEKAIAGLQEVRQLIQDPVTININAVNQMTYFSSLFGRETAYVSLLRVK